MARKNKKKSLQSLSQPTACADPPPTPPPPSPFPPPRSPRQKGCVGGPFTDNDMMLFMTINLSYQSNKISYKISEISHKSYQKTDGYACPNCDRGQLIHLHGSDDSHREYFRDGDKDGTEHLKNKYFFLEKDWHIALPGYYNSKGSPSESLT